MWNCDVGAGVDNRVALDDYDAICDQRFRFPVEHSRRFESNRCGFSGASRKDHRGERQERREKTKEILHGFEYEMRARNARLPTSDGPLTRRTISVTPA